MSTGQYEQELSRIEAESPAGLTSQEILQVLSDLGLSFSEASLRKYVQIGLLPRSVRVGEKGKHRGSKGVYPVRVVRQILAIKEMMAKNYTIEQIQEQFLFVRGELDELDQRLSGVFEKFSSKTRGGRGRADLGIARELNAAKGVGRDLMQRLRTLETRLTSGNADSGGIVEAAG